MSGGSAWLPWAVLIPLAGALAALLVGRRAAGPVAAVASVLTVAACAAIATEVTTVGPARHFAGGWSPPLGIALRADGLAAVVLGTLSGVGGLITVFALGEFRRRSRLAGRFFPLWLFGWAALNALILSADVFNLYVTLELSTLTSVALISLANRRPALGAAAQYLLLAVAGSLSYLLGIALLFAVHRTLDLSMLGERLADGPAVRAGLALILVGLCLKAALFPLHAWLPAAYDGALAPVAALLSGLLSNAAFYVLLRLWLELGAGPIKVAAGQLLGALGGAAVIWGSLLALRAQRLRPVLAYSSIAQLGYLFLLFQIDTPAAWAAGVYLLISHAAAKAALFLAAGTLERAVGHDRVEGLQGLAGRLPPTVFAIALSAVGLIGLPPSGAFVGKWAMLRAAAERGQWWPALVLLGGGLLAAGYCFRFLRQLFVPPTQPVVLRRIAPHFQQLATLSIALLGLGLGLWPELPLRLLGLGAR